MVEILHRPLPSDDSRYLCLGFFTILDARPEEPCSHFRFGSLFERPVNTGAAYDLPDVWEGAVLRVHGSNAVVSEFHPTMAELKLPNNV